MKPLAVLLTSDVTKCMQLAQGQTSAPLRSSGRGIDHAAVDSKRDAQLLAAVVVPVRPGSVEQPRREVARLQEPGQGATQPGEEPDQGAQGVDEGEGGDGIREVAERAPQRDGDGGRPEGRRHDGGARPYGQVYAGHTVLVVLLLTAEVNKPWW